MDEILNDVFIQSHPIREGVSLNKLESRAFEKLSSEWAALADLKDDAAGIEYDIYQQICWYGIVEIQEISPYTVNSDGAKLYRGTRYKIRKKQPSGD